MPDTSQSPKQPEKVRLFLSHAGEDTDAAKELAHKLSDAGVEVWLDVERLHPGDRWMEQIEKGIAWSGAFAVYVGERGVTRWIDRETRLALDRNAKDPSYRILPILSEQADRSSLPPFLTLHQFTELPRSNARTEELKRPSLPLQKQTGPKYRRRR